MSNITIRVRARGTGSYIITSPDGLTNLIEVTPTGVNILGNPYAPGGGGNYLQFTGGTAFWMRLTGTPTANRTFTFPNVVDDEVLVAAADQYVTNKRLAGTGMRVQAFGAGPTSLCQGMSFDACGLSPTAAGGIGLSVLVPFYANNDALVPVPTKIAGIVATMASPTSGSERGHLCLYAGRSGTLAEVLRASLPDLPLLYTCGVNVIGADANNNAAIVGLGKADAGVDIRPLTTGSVRVRNGADTETLLGMEYLAGVPRLVVSGGVDLGVAPEINKVMGQVEIQTGSQTLTVLNSLVKSTSVVQCVLQSSDALLTQLLNVIPGDGSFVVTGNGVAGTNVKVGFIVFNPAA